MAKAPFKLGGKGKFPGKASPFESETPTINTESTPETPAEPTKPTQLDAGFTSDEMACVNCKHFSEDKCGLNVKGADYTKWDPNYSRCKKFEDGTGETEINDETATNLPDETSDSVIEA